MTNARLPRSVVHVPAVADEAICPRMKLRRARCPLQFVFSAEPRQIYTPPTQLAHQSLHVGKVLNWCKKCRRHRDASNRSLPTERLNEPHPLPTPQQVRYLPRNACDSVSALPPSFPWAQKAASCFHRSSAGCIATSKPNNQLSL